MISALERAPGSTWPIERSPRKEARPRDRLHRLRSPPPPRRRSPRCSPAGLPADKRRGDRKEHVEHGLLPGLRFAARGDRFDRLGEGGGERGAIRLGRQLLAERQEQRAEQRARGAADRHHQLGADRLQRIGQRLAGDRAESPRTASKPRFMLSPWSPSPIAWSSAVSSSACARDRVGDRRRSACRCRSPPWSPPPSSPHALRRRGFLPAVPDMLVAVAIDRLRALGKIAPDLRGGSEILQPAAERFDGQPVVIAALADRREGLGPRDVAAPGNAAIVLGDVDMDDVASTCFV